MGLQALLEQSESLEPVEVLDEEQIRIEKILRVGYSTRLQESFPFNDDIRNCKSRDDAYFYALQETFTAPPPQELSIQALQDYISPEDFTRIGQIWDVMRVNHRRWIGTGQRLQEIWQNPPESNDENAQTLVESVMDETRNTFKAANIALIDETKNENIIRWRKDERNARIAYFKDLKEYLVSLRLYYELLLENNHKKRPHAGDRKCVLPKDHPQFKELLIRNRYARLIDSALFSFATGKSVHHEQVPEEAKDGSKRKRDKRLRKSGDPYISHPIAATLAYIIDVVPFVIEADRLEFSFLPNSQIIPIHDVKEDTRYHVSQAIEKLKQVVDSYDTNIDQKITSAFGVERRKFMHYVLDLMFGKSDPKKVLHPVLRAVSKDTPLSAKEISAALVANVAGPERTIKLLGLTTTGIGTEGEFDANKPRSRDNNPINLSAYKRRGIRRIEHHPYKCFTEFPEVYEEKTDATLVRASAICENIREKDPVRAREIMHYVLITKIADRWHNTANMKDEVEYRKRTLRANVTRLIAFVMLDFDQDKYSLYNLIGRLIDTTMAEYEKYKAEYQGTEHFEECDQEYMAQLGQWQQDVKRYEATDDLSHGVMRRVNEAFPIEGVAMAA